MINQLNTKKSLLTVVSLCQDHYQILLIIYQKDFIGISALIVNLILTVCHSKMINLFLGWLTD